MELAPDRLGPTVCVGEILVEIVATTIGDGFREAQSLVGPYPSGAPAIFIDQCGRIAGKKSTRPARAAARSERMISVG